MIVIVKNNHDEERYIEDAACVIPRRHGVRVCFDGGKPDEEFMHDHFTVSVVP